MEVASIPRAKFRPEEVEAFSADRPGMAAQQSQPGSARSYSTYESAVFCIRNKSVFNHFLLRTVASEIYANPLIFNIITMGDY